MAYYSDYHGQVNGSTSTMENLQEQVSKLSQTLHDLARQRGIVLDDGPMHYDPYSNGYSPAAPICHICGIHGHTPADCQHGGYSPTPDCFGMNFAHEHGSYHYNSSPGWPENPSMTYRNSSPPISSFSPSYPMQEFRCGEKNQYNQHQFYAAPAYAPEFHQEHHQFSAQPTPLEEQSSWLNERFPQTTTSQPVHQAQELVPMELNGPPEVQDTTSDYDDTDKLSLLCLEYTWTAEDHPLRPVLIQEMKKIKDGTDLIEELKKIEKNMKLSNIVSLQLELELSAPEILLDTCEVPIPSYTDEPAIDSSEGERSQIFALEDEEVAAIEDEEKEEIQVDKDDAIQEHDETGLSNPLDDMFPFEPSAITLHYMIPLLKEEMKNDLLNFDHKNLDCDIVYDAYDDTNNSNAKILPKDACFNIAHTTHPNAIHYHHVLYCYTYVIGYSIDDLVGVNPITCANFSLYGSNFRILLVHYSLRSYMVRVDIPWDPGGFMAWC